MNLKLNLGALLAPIFLLIVSCTEELKSNSTEQAEVPVRNIQAEKAFKNIDTLKAYFCDYPEECERYKKLTFIKKRKFEERVTKNRVRLAQNFLDSFPNDARYFEVLRFFFNQNFEPRFLVEEIPDSLSMFFSKEIKYGTPEYFKRLRSLPIDVKAQDEWLNQGYELAEKFLQTNAPLEKKLIIEMAILGRDFRQALRIYKGLNIQKKGLEARYWKEFDKFYWEFLRLRIISIAEKYSELEVIANNIEQFMSVTSQLTPHLKEEYWEGFLSLTEGHPLSKNAGFKAIHEMAKKNLEALEHVDYNKPLDISFTAVDGTKINLADLRGKVVLIDFWTIRCPPCIKEMPHIQAMYEKYRDQGFEVIGLAGNGDESKDRVLEIIKKQGATWPQRLDKGKDVIVSYHSLFNINSYPTVWLLNKEGIIVDKNARGIRLEPLIRLHLGLEN
ncbi:TlpA disulfide reductase family protein [Galbibacter sp. EGI 63066]|uniref:TlpA family protein disulfide reductase n=1 Tax=Galbibacter sp. EGI 63066 TaxID=2993559 RepID=UPI002249171A|nr:TlpA disulfide reductase family protein [Galbibacter sp. EGI 63066]MCX2681899.1 TlpA disulfide reductase family protein [Galbibacter sp. EGI 63066]